MCFVALTVSCCMIGAIRYLRIRTAVIFALIPLVAFVRTGLYMRANETSYDRNGILYGVVTDERTYFQSKGLTLSSISSDIDVPEGAGIRLYTSVNSAYKYGDIIRCEGTFSPTGTVREKANGIDFTFEGDTAFSSADGGFFTDLRRDIAKLCDESFGKEVAAFIKAVTIADRSGMGNAENALFAKAGASHVLAVSGMHLSIIVTFLYLILKKLVKNRFVCSAAGCAAAFCFCAVAGFPYSAVRAGIMLCITFAASAISARADPFTSLFAAVGLIVIIEPYAAASVSLQLSFLATLGIITAGRSIENRAGAGMIKSKLFSLFITPLYMSLAVALFTLPAAINNFGKYSVLAPVSMFVCTLLFAPLLAGSYAFFLLSAVMPFARNVFAFLPRVLTELFTALIKLIASLPFAASPFYPPAVPYICALCVIIAAMLLLLGKNARKTVFALSCGVVPLILAAAIAIPFFTRGIAISYRDNFGGYSAAVSGGDGCVYIDSGSTYAADEVFYGIGYSVCEKLIIVRAGDSSDELITLFATAYGTETVYLPSPDPEDGPDQISVAASAALEAGCEVEFYDTLNIKTGESVIRIFDRNAVIETPDETVCISRSYLFDGEHVYDKIILPSSYYRAPKGDIDLKARYYTAYADFPSNNVTFIRRGDCIVITQ